MLKKHKSKQVVIKVFRHNMKRKMMKTVSVKFNLPQTNCFSKIEGWYVFSTGHYVLMKSGKVLRNKQKNKK